MVSGLKGDNAQCVISSSGSITVVPNLGVTNPQGNWNLCAPLRGSCNSSGISKIALLLQKGVIYIPRDTSHCQDAQPVE